MKYLVCKYILIICVLLTIVPEVKGQTALPEELTRNTIKEQIKYIEDKTRIYENYRAIREDMFQKINKNILDSLTSGKNRIASLNNLISSLNQKSDSLKSSLETTKITLEETTRTKNSIRVFGMNINKIIYNSFMWLIVAGLVLALAIGFVVFKRIMNANISTKKELKELRDEFEAYRQSARIAREKAALDHFNEIKKMKGI